ncbi:MAG: branched-chain amino acid ABC transporter permease [Dehalococcoidia bacterium]|nr:branched-chain amino acid ABC transporter permease [Dehalococcoidia bacterium]
MGNITAVLFRQDILVFMGVNILLAWGVYLAFATGQISLGHGAFMAVGAYASGIFTVKLGLPLPLAMVVALVTSGTFGILVGFPALRIPGLQLMIATMGIAEMVRTFFRNVEYVGGNEGFPGLRGTTVILVYATVFVCLIFMWKLSRSRMGQAFRAIEMDEQAATAMGLNTTYLKVLAFGLGSAIAALGGALYAHYVYIIEPDHFNITQSFIIALFIVLGGGQNFWGPAIGAIIITLLPEYLRAFDQYRFIIYGAILMIMMVIRPEGLISNSALRTLSRHWDLLSRWLSPWLSRIRTRVVIGSPPGATPLP